MVLVRSKPRPARSGAKADPAESASLPSHWPTATKPRLLPDMKAADYIGMSVAFLRADRYRGHVGGRTPGPAFIRLGRAVRYRIEDLDLWLAEQRVDRTRRNQAAGR